MTGGRRDKGASALSAPGILIFLRGAAEGVILARTTGCLILSREARLDVVSGETEGDSAESYCCLRRETAPEATGESLSTGVLGFVGMKGVRVVRGEFIFALTCSRFGEWYPRSRSGWYIPSTRSTGILQAAAVDEWSRGLSAGRTSRSKNKGAQGTHFWPKAFVKVTKASSADPHGPTFVLNVEWSCAL